MGQIVKTNDFLHGRLFIIGERNMELVKITIKNFKGINYLEFNLSKSPHNNVYTLVGINESGKTTILEAINFFEYNDEKDLIETEIKFEDIEI